MKNIAYKTEELKNYFSQNRVSWDQFYNSEKQVIQRLELGSQASILDIGCGCGCLGLALSERYSIDRYVGVEINDSAANYARVLNPAAKIYQGDFLEVSKAGLNNILFDVFFSLSCFDWNIQFQEMFEAAWRHVAPGGVLVATFRLTTQKGCSDFKKSFQYINYSGELIGEKAPYVVMNISDLMKDIIGLNPESIYGFGYYGPPSKTAITPYKTICFTGMSIRKKIISDSTLPEIIMDIPEDINSLYRT
jgi:precorrin-6B methylase 2